MLLISSPAPAQQWLLDANARIEQYRMADLTVDVIDSLGNPVPNAEVHVEMKRHTFGFGTAVTAKLLNDPSPTGVIYRQKLVQNFNQVVFENDLKWPAWIGQWGSGFNWPNTEQALDWLDANHLPARGHYLSWATWSGSDAWGNSQDVATLPRRLFDHITDKATTVGNRVFEWDVINHPVGWLNDTYENRIGIDFYGDIIDHARSVAPAGMDLWINEDDVIAGQGRANEYARVIEQLIADGSAPDGIGFQGHFIQDWGRVTGTPIEQLYDRIDRFADIIPRLRVTELDIDVGNNEAWQGQLLRDYLTVMFSHPDMEAITLWGFWGGAHWRNENGALYRNDWTEKPSLTAYQDLVFNQWWTDATGMSDMAGQHSLRAFQGLYDITVHWGGQDYSMSDYVLKENDTVQFLLSNVVISPADFNVDGHVDDADLAIWKAALGNHALGDADGDGDSDGADFLIWQREYTSRLGVTVASVVVPEPASAILWLGLSGLLPLLTVRGNRKV